VSGRRSSERTWKAEVVVTEEADRRSVLLERVCELTQMPFPNLVYRRLAEKPERLEMCLYRVEAALEQMDPDAVRAAVTSPRAVGRVIAPRWSLDRPDRTTLSNVLTVYNRGNALNAVLVELWLNGSTGRSPDSWPARREPPVDVSLPSLPPMLTLEQMRPSVVMRVQSLAKFIDETQNVVPSMFRHLGESPTSVEWIEECLGAAAEDGTFDTYYLLIQQRIRSVVERWPSVTPAVDDPDVRNILEPFAHTIPRMVVVGHVLQEALTA
jgi:hypothetical protein